MIHLLTMERYKNDLLFYPLNSFLFLFTEENISKLPDESEPAQPQTTSMASMVGAAGEQTTLITNEDEAFALPPLDATVFPGTSGMIYYSYCHFHFLYE